jgi:dolichyl-phosphate beta-glucosyltransferase
MITSLSIIFPVFNEELRLKSGFNHIENFLRKKKKFKTEIIFVDDGSEDNSYNLIEKFINKLKGNSRINIKVIRSKNNLGKGRALKLGIKKAKYDWILTTDIDMSVSLFQFLDWLKKKLIKKKYSVYFGSRTHKKSIVKKKFIRNILGNIMRFFVSTILDIKIKDTQCGYKLYKKKVAKLIFSKIKNYGFDHDLELILILKSRNIKIKELPVKWIHRDNSRINIYWDPIKMLVGIFLLKFRNF